MWIHSNFEALTVRVRVHFGYSVIMYSGINTKSLYPGWNEESSRILSYDLHLQHTVHESDPVVNPRETTTCALYITTDDAAEEAAKILL